MTWTVSCFTVIHVAPAALEPIPYAVVVARDGEEQAIARADGALNWLSIGAPTEIAGGTARSAEGA